VLGKFPMSVLARAAPVAAIVVFCSFSLAAMGDVALAEASGRLQLEIGADKSRYLVGEPIWIDVVLKNVSQDTVRVGHRIMEPESWTLEFFVVTDGETLPYTGGRASVIYESLDLPPGGELPGQFDILQYYGKCGEGTKGFERFLDPGVYSIRARAFRSVTSNALEVEVLEPSGREAEIYRIFHEAAVLDAHRHYEEAAEKLQSLLRSASSSTYRDKLYYMLIRVLHTDRRRQRDLAERVLREYPDSRYARFCLTYVLYGMTRAEAEKFVSSLESAAPGTRAAVEARRLLRTYEFRK